MPDTQLLLQHSELTEQLVPSEWHIGAPEVHEPALQTSGELHMLPEQHA